MEPKMEQPKPKQYTPDEMAQFEKSRTISDAELLKGGAEYKIDEEGEKRLHLTDEQIEKAKKETETEKELRSAADIAMDKYKPEEAFVHEEFDSHEKHEMVNVLGEQFAGMDRVLDMAEVYDTNNPDKNPQMQGMALNKEQLRQLFFSMPDAVEMLDKIFSGNYSTDKIFELVGELNDKYFRNKEISGRYSDVRFPEAPDVSSFRMKIYKADDGTIEACSFSVSR